MPRPDPEEHEADAFLARVQAVTATIQPKDGPPPYLHHYTSADGLVGILLSGKVHACDMSHANDPTEARYARTVLTQALDARISSEPRAASVLSLVRDVLAAGPGPVGAFAFSMSEVDDLLSQWRAYAATGLGYCIGFRTDSMRTIDPDAPPDPFFRLARFIYDADEQAARAAALVDAVFERSLDVSRGDRARTAMTLFMMGAQSAFAIFKDPAYREEREWRAIAMGPISDDVTNVSFRARDGHVVAYEPIDLWGGGQRKSTALPIGSVRFGPRSDTHRGTESVRLLLKKCGYTDVRLQRSTVPLR